MDTPIPYTELNMADLGFMEPQHGPFGRGLDAIIYSKQSTHKILLQLPRMICMGGLETSDFEDGTSNSIRLLCSRDFAD